MVHTNSQFSAEMARKRALVPCFLRRFLRDSFFLRGLRNVEIVEAVPVDEERLERWELEWFVEDTPMFISSVVVCR